MNLKLLFLPILLLLSVLPADASQPLRRQVVKQMADGSRVLVSRAGDEHQSWWETPDGRRFVMSADRQLVPAQFPLVAPPVAHRSLAASTEDGLGSYGESGMGIVRSLGSPLIPVILVAFSDLDFLEDCDAKKVDRFLNEEGYADEPLARGSVRDYYVHSSYGAFSPRFEVVTKVTLSKGYKYYGGHDGSAVDAHRQELVREAVQLAERQDVDFSRFATDGSVPLVSIIHAGPGEQEDYGKDSDDYLWAHFMQTTITGTTATIRSYLMTNECMRDFDNHDNVTNQYMTGIGTFCHEFGHALGLPDMYDVNGKTGGAGQTPGFWDVMDYQFMMNGFRPMEFSGYERSMLGWLKAEELPAPQVGQTIRLAPINDGETADPRLYYYRNPENSTEYLLFENRRLSPFYASNYLGEGMLVWHIDYGSTQWAGNTVNTIADHQRVAVVPADGEWQENRRFNDCDDHGQRYTFPGDLYPGYTGKQQFDRQDADFYVGQMDCVISGIQVENDGTITFTLGTTEHVDKMHHPNLLSTDGLYNLWGRPLTGSTGTHKGISVDECGKKSIR